MNSAGQSKQYAIVRFGDFELDTGKRVLRRAHGGGTVSLTPRVFDTLLCLVEHHGEIVEKRVLLETVWQNVIVEENNLTQAISILRRALGERPQEHQYIVTEPGRGYRFVAPVHRVVSDPRVPEVPGSSSGIRRRAMLAGIAGGAIGAAWLVSRVGGRQNESERFSGLFTNHSQIFLPAGNHTEPTLSPEGSRIAFVSDIEGGQKVFVKVLDGGDPRPITSGEYRVRMPSWSPQNNEIIFTQFDENGAPRAIRSVDPQGTGESRPFIDLAQYGSFSADGSTIVFEKGKEIWLANADGTNQRRVDGIPEREWITEWAFPALSPDGKLIAYYRQHAGPVGDIWLIPAAGGASRALTNERRQMGRPVFDPSGRYVYYSAQRQPDGPWSIWRVPVAGGEPEAMTSGPGECRFPAISADGLTLVYLNTRTTTQFKITDPFSGETESLPSNGAISFFPAISRDGTRFAFFSELNPRERLFVQNIDGTGLRQVTDTDDGSAHIMPGWGTDDAFLFFYDGFGDGGLLRVPVEGGVPEPWFPDVIRGPTMAPALSPSGDQLAFVRNSDPPRVVIRGIASGDEQVLGSELNGWPRWSRDGAQILGTGTEGIAICEVASGQCRTIYRGADLVPAFSMDQSRIFFSRPVTDGDSLAGRRRMLEIWIVDKDGRNDEHLCDIGPKRDIDGPFDVTADDRILWNEYLQVSEIWRATTPE